VPGRQLAEPGHEWAVQPLGVGADVGAGPAEVACEDLGEDHEVRMRPVGAELSHDVERCAVLRGVETGGPLDEVDGEGVHAASLPD
jgi:hypothetical protein